MSWRVESEALYLGDNGRCLCGDHLGATGKATGRDISGQALERVTPEAARYARDECGFDLTCEQPRCGRVASLLVRP